MASLLGDKRLKKELAILFAILAAFVVLSVRPFGFRYFLHGLANNDLFSIVMVMGMVGVILVMLQRLGIVFADTDSQKIV